VLFFPLAALGLTLWAVGGTVAHGWRREDVRVLAVIGGAWFGLLVAGPAGILPGALYVVLVLIGWWAARKVTRLVRWVLPHLVGPTRRVRDYLTNRSELA
jgi:hypothetical protein